MINGGDDARSKTPRALYLGQITANRASGKLPDYVNAATFRVLDHGDVRHKHEWQKSETEDYVTWSCQQCGARCGAEVNE